MIRISGPRARELARKFFRPPGGRKGGTGSDPDWKPRHLYRVEIRGKKGEILDDGLLAFMPAPFSYTGEDVVEIQGHGSPVLAEELIGNLVEAGARLANRGEFTLRAYLRGKLDLTQAEAVLDLVRAQTREGLSQAAGQLLGRLRDKIEAWREALIAGRARLEAEIDFPEDVPEDRAGKKELKQTLEKVESEIAGLLSSFREGKILQEGLKVALIGRPNVGKSSLFNALLKRERALVDPDPGTTRDVIEASACIKGRKVIYYDTAGRRETGGRVERAGIRMADRFLGCRSDYFGSGWRGKAPTGGFSGGRVVENPERKRIRSRGDPTSGVRSGKQGGPAGGGAGGRGPGSLSRGRVLPGFRPGRNGAGRAGGRDPGSGHFPQVGS